MPGGRPEYSRRDYRDRLAHLKTAWVLCEWCGMNRATSPDHYPSLCHSPPGAWTGQLVDACRRCNLSRGAREMHSPDPWRASRDW